MIPETVPPPPPISLPGKKHPDKTIPPKKKPPKEDDDETMDDSDPIGTDSGLETLLSSGIGGVSFSTIFLILAVFFVGYLLLKKGK
jgi:hypothetical protein